MADANEHSSTPAHAADGARNRLDELVRLNVGLAVRTTDLDRLASWSGARATALGLARSGSQDVEAYGQLLAENSDRATGEREMLTSQFSTGESYFFRDQGQFDLLAQKILPELIERRAAERRLRIWSAGCAAGQEAYSLAMLVDRLAPRLASWNVLILGTDINSEALQQARRGLYGEWSFRALDAERKQRYFRPHGDQWQIDARLRNMVTFRSGDLIRDRFPGADAAMNEFDLILCRNVFIYLDANAVGRITAKFAAALAEGGTLVTGHSELFGHDTAPLRVRMFAQSAVFQKATQAPAETGLGEAIGQALKKVEQTPPARVSAPASRAEAQPPVPVRSKIPAPPPAEDCDRLMQAAWRHADHGMPDAAMEDCRKAIAVAGFDPRPYFLLAQLAQERGDTAQAKALLDKAIYLDPAFIAAYLELGALHAQTGESERARRMYETARSALQKLPAQTLVPPYSESTAADILTYVERQLGGPAPMPNGEHGVRNDSAFRNEQSAYE